jgi:hypothetical protein
MRSWFLGFSSRHPLLAALCVLLAIIVGFIDSLWSLVEKVTPLLADPGTGVDWPPISLGWLPWITTPLGLILLVLIYRQTLQQGPRHDLPLGNPRRIPKHRRIRRKRVRVAD